MSRLRDVPFQPVDTKLGSIRSYRFGDAICVEHQTIARQERRLQHCAGLGQICEQADRRIVRVQPTDGPRVFDEMQHMARPVPETMTVAECVEGDVVVLTTHHRLLRTRAFAEWEMVTCAC